jgi:serine protease
MSSIGKTALVLGALSAGLVSWHHDTARWDRASADLAVLDDGLTITISDDIAYGDVDGPGTLVVDLVDGTTEAELAAVSAATGYPLAWVHRDAADEALAWVEVDDLDEAMARFAGVQGIEVVEPLLPMTLPEEVAAPDRFPPESLQTWSTPNDPLYPQQWHLRDMGAPAGWANSPAGEGVIVAVVDTGVSPVEDLGGTVILQGASFVSGVSSWADDNGHGTHVAGTIAQTTNNGLGVAGVAPNAQILPVKVLSGFGGGTSAGVAAGIDWAVDHGAQVINLSLGSGMPSRVVSTAVKKAHAAGVVVVAAAGNDGRRSVSWPGALPEAIGVGAIGPDGTRAPYSNWGVGVDIAAPGGDKRQEGGGVLQDTIDRTDGHAYKSLQGTSMAAPHVSGAAAVLLSTGFLDATDVHRLLLAGADGPVWQPEYGWGRLDLERSLELVGSTDRESRFALGALFAGLMAGAAGAGLGFRLLSMFAGGVAGGGLFFLSSTGGALAGTLSRGLLSWPIVWFGPITGQLALWLGAFVAVGLAFLFAPFRLTRPLALGACGGISAHLVFRLAVGDALPWYLGGDYAMAWLAANATVAAAAGLVVAMVHRIATKHGVDA